MLTVECIDEASPYLEAVKNLWRRHSATLGYLPDGAFADYAHDRHIVVARNGEQCVGYLLYRTARKRVTIAHFCVAPDARKQGVARAMLNYLVAITKNYRGIVLTCRRDFDASKTWPRLGFHVIGELPGRAPGSELVRWLLDYAHADLFSSPAEPSGLQAGMDFNILLDLIEDRSDETRGLLADWLRPLISLCYTPELLNEINRNDTAELRQRRLREVQQFSMLCFSHAAFKRADALLRPLFPKLKSEREESDFRHLVGAVAAGADAFLTRDEDLLQHADDVFSICGLPVVRPAELIGRLDTIEREREYQRSFLAGTRQIMQERVSRADDSLAEAIQHPDEQRSKVTARLNRYLADPKRFRCERILGSDGATIAVLVVERDSGVDRVPMLRICAKRQSGALARSILTDLVRRAAELGSNAVLVSEPSMPDAVRAACSSLGFLSVSEGELKLIISGLLTVEQAAQRLTWPDEKIEQLALALRRVRTEPHLASQVEHLLWPLKLADGHLRSFIVPIRPQFAAQIVDERLAGSSLFGVDVDLALNCEAVYYRAARPAVVAFPGRVLWYVSKCDDYAGTMTIRACSRLIEVAIDTPKRLYSRFRRLGVFEWQHVRNTAKGDLTKKIMAFRFDDSEHLRPVGREAFQRILRSHGIKTNLQSPIEIPPEAFNEIYASAVDSPSAR